MSMYQFGWTLYAGHSQQRWYIWISLIAFPHIPYAIIDIFVGRILNEKLHKFHEQNVQVNLITFILRTIMGIQPAVIRPGNPFECLARHLVQSLNYLQSQKTERKRTQFSFI